MAQINLESKNIEIAGHSGSWYVTDTQTVENQQYFLLEHEIYGDEAAGVIVDTNGNLILDDVYNGFDDLRDFFDDKANISEDKIELATIYYSDTNENINYFNEEIFINAVKENFNILGVNGWEIEFVSASPALRKKIEDIKCSEFGYSNPYDLEHYEKNDFTLINNERKNELYDNWKNETNEEETQQWRDEITMPQEQALINKWDNEFDESISKMLNTALKTSENIMPRLFVDMDGTLAVFKPVDTLETLYEKGYFENLEPQQNVIDAVRAIALNNPEIEVNILSSVLTDSEFALKEKNSWLDKYLPEISNANRIFPPCGEDKKAFINNLKETDFLLDDYTKNLTLWEPPAKGIKLINAINDTHGTWQGRRVNYNESPDKISQSIIQSINSISHHKQELAPLEQSKILRKEIEHDTQIATQQKNSVQKLSQGNIIFSKVNLPRYSDKVSGKLFVVNEIKPDGGFLAYKLTGNDERSKLKQSVSIKMDKDNRLAMNSVVMANEIFDFPSGYQYTKMHGSLTSEQMSIINEERQKAEYETILFGDNIKLTDKDKARQLIENLYENFKNDPSQLAEYLAFKAKFYNFSENNKSLIFSQNPFATFVASKTKFIEMGYNVVDHKNSIKLLRPVSAEIFYRNNGEQVLMSDATRDEKEKIKQGEIKLQSTKTKRFKFYDTYDISQTDCPREHYPSIYSMGISSEQHNDYYNKISSLMERIGIDVHVKDLRSISLSGYYSPKENNITINGLLNDSQRLSTMCHEAAHALLHKTSTQPVPVKEFEAQCAAILLQSHLGLKLEQNDISYLCSYVDKTKGLPGFNMTASLNRVQKQVNYINDNIGLSNNTTLAIPRAQHEQNIKRPENPVSHER